MSGRALSRRPTRFSIAMTAFAKLGHRPRGAQAQRFLTELDRRLDGADARVSSCSYTHILCLHISV